MAAFDPSVIAQIGGNTPNVVPDRAGSYQRALTLKDMVDHEQLDRLELGRAQKEQADQAAIRGILSSSRYDTPEGLSETVGKINKISPELGMKFMRAGQEIISGQRQQKIEQLSLADRQHDAVAGALDTIRAQAEDMAAHGISEAGVNAFIQAQVQYNARRLASQKFDDGSPMIPPQVLQQAQQIKSLPQLIAAEEQSNRGQEMLKQRLAEMRGNLAERHEQAYEADVASRASDRSEKATERESAKLGPDEIAFTAQQYLAGDKSVFTGLGRGNQGADNIAALRREITKQARAAGMSARDVAATLAEYNGLVASERTIGTTAGRVEFAGAELGQTLPLARAASAKVPRGSFVPFNRLMQSGESSISDPALKDFYVKTNAVLNAYDQLAARGGTDVAKREHNRQMLLTSDSPHAYNAALSAIEQELQAARTAGQQARRNVATEVSGRAPPAATQPPTGAPGAASGAGPGATGAAKPSWAE